MNASEARRRQDWVEAPPGLVFGSGGVRYLVLGAFVNSGKVVIAYTDPGQTETYVREIWGDSLLWELGNNVAQWEMP